MNRDELVEHLVASRVAGDVATSRESNVDNIDKMLRRDWDYHFGLSLDRAWTPDEVLAVMAKRVGIDPDPGRRTGTDRIDPDLTADALEAAADLLARAAADRAPVFVATGHPTGVLSLHLAVAAALAAAGCRLLGVPDGLAVPERGRMRSLGGVAMVTNGADFLHTHAAEPMQRLLATWGADRPALVLADHGWAGAAAEAGLTVVGLADTNDPAMFVGAEEGKVAVAVPLDDNVAPHLYEPLAALLVAAVAGA
ncbi:MAG: hypothetical protein QOD07_1426 [Frankiaceae bacterium]|jgi:hypothetical protein|nr:hypothetical protein [Frankiaceae bacterium]